MHVPLRRLALCLDCDECFEIGVESCPACGSETWTALARFIESTPEGAASRLVGDIVNTKNGSRRQKGARQLVIVERGRVKLFEHLRRAFAGNDTVDVILDQRLGQRRRTKGPASAERRRSDRRVRVGVDQQLRTIGWSVLLLDVTKNGRPTIR